MLHNRPCTVRLQLLYMCLANAGCWDYVDPQRILFDPGLTSIAISESLARSDLTTAGMAPTGSDFPPLLDHRCQSQPLLPLRHRRKGRQINMIPLLVVPDMTRPSAFRRERARDDSNLGRHRRRYSPFSNSLWTGSCKAFCCFTSELCHTKAICCLPSINTPKFRTFG
jgi:hypothetical protein